MKDAQGLLASRQIECLTVPSDKCPKGLCDGTGFRWFINYDKKTNWPVYAKKIEQLQIEIVEARTAENPELVEQLRAQIIQVKKIEWQDPCKCYQAKQEQQKINAIVGQSNIPLEFEKAKVHGFKTDIYKDPSSRIGAELAKKMALSYIEKFSEMQGLGKGLYLYSRTKGAGKTRIACSIANALMNVHLQSVLYAKAIDISLKVRKTYSNDSDVSEDDVIEVFRNVDVLVIDDFAVERSESNTKKKSDFMEQLYYKILDYRMEQKKITIITSNITIAEINDYYPDPNGNTDGRIYSRVNKMCLQVNMPEESIRDLESTQENEWLERMLLQGGA